MKIGAVFPQLEIGADPAVIRAWAEAVEEVGYTHVLAYDHVLGASPDHRPGGKGTPTSPCSMRFSCSSGIWRRSLSWNW
jgi:hypothetical protein